MERKARDPEYNFLPQANQCSAHPQAAIVIPCLSTPSNFQPPSVSILRMLLYGMEHPSGQLQCPALDMPPQVFLVHLVTGRAWKNEKPLI